VTIERSAESYEGTVAGPVSDDGRLVAVVSRGTNLGGPATFQENVYVRDRRTATTRLVSVGNDGALGDLDSIDPVMTPDGRMIAFASRSSTFVPETQDFFAYDIFTHELRRR